MDKDYFVMLNHPSKNIQAMPMIIDVETNNVAWFETEEHARKAAEDSMLGEAYGFEIFRRGYGE